MTDKIPVTVLKQKVFHDGQSMVVLKAGQDDAAVAERYIAGLVEEGVIDKPEGWKAPLAEAAAQADVQDGSLPFSGSIPRLGNIAALEHELAAVIAERDDLRAKLAALDGDGDGGAGGSKPQEPPALTGKNKAELQKIAADEGVTIADDATNAAIVDAIEAARAQGAGEGAPPA